MAMEGNSRKSEQGHGATGKAEAMAAKSKGAGWKPLPKRGDVLKRILKDIKDTMTGCVPASENSRVAPDH